MGFWPTVLAGVLATSFGAFIGILSALWLDRRGVRQRDKREQKAEEDRRRSRREHLLRLLRDTFDRNRGIISRLEKSVSSKESVTFNVDLTQLESTASLKYELIDDLDLNRRLDRARYALSHLSRAVELHAGVLFDPARMRSTLGPLPDMVTKEVREALSITRKAINEAVEAIDEALASEHAKERIP